MTEHKTQTATKADLYDSMFRFQEGIYQNALLGMTEEQALCRPSDKSNHINWLMGHILHCRFMLTNMLGVKAENPFGNRYWSAIDEQEYPALEKVTGLLPAITATLTKKLTSLSDEEFDARPASDKPSVSDIVSFFVYHEAYHLGQIGYARKIIGLDPLQSS